MKIKRFHGNITILTLFILLSCALMWVLVALYMKNFIRYSDEITSYEKTSYLARAWTELGLAIVWSREVGLVYSIASWDSIRLNFDCPYPVDEWKECPVDPKFSLSIDWLWDSYQNCNWSEKIEIGTWLSAIIPLFSDKWVVWGISDALIAPEESNLNKRNLDGLSADTNPAGSIWNYWIVWMESDNSLYIEKWKGDKGKLKDKNPVQTSIWRNAYFIVSNPSTTENQRICITDANWRKIAQETVKIVSIWYYNDRQLWTETLTTKALPSFLQWDNYIY
jgi:hypothetical protein